MKSFFILTIVMLAVSARAETQRFSIGEIDLANRTEAQMPKEITQSYEAPASSSEYFALPKANMTMAEVSYGEKAVDFSIMRGIARNLYLSAGAATTTNNDDSAYELAITKRAELAGGNLIFGAHAQAINANIVDGMNTTTHQYLAAPFVGFQKTEGRLTSGGELTVEQALVNPTAVFKENTFLEAAPTGKFTIGAKAGINQAAGYQFGYQAGLYSKYSALKNTDIRVAVDSESVKSSVIENSTTFTVGVRQSL
jgi:hypothetical protein